MRARPLSPALIKAWQSALHVTPEMIAGYIPNRLDIGIAEAVLSGAVNFAEISQYLACKPEEVARYMQDSIAVAWIGDQIQKHIEKRLFLVTASIFSRAVAGDMTAARLLLEKFGQLVKRTATLKADVNALSDREIDQLLKKHQVVDLDSVQRETPNSGAAAGTGTSEA